MLFEVLRFGCQKRSPKLLLIALSLGGSLALDAEQGFAHEGRETWRPTGERHGIASFESARPGRPLSAYRARMELPGEPWDALAVLEDIGHACEWTSHCGEMRKLRAASDRDLTVYARIDAPWPVRDRDVIVRVRVQIRTDELFVAIRSLDFAGMPPPSGVVRMPRFIAHYRFRPISPTRTEVEYQIDVDPGGTLPDWLKRMVARDLAHDTLADLRTRVRWTSAQGTYRARTKRLELRARADGFGDAGREAALSREAERP